MGRNTRKENSKWQPRKRKPIDKDNFLAVNGSNGCTPQMLPLDGGVSIIWGSFALVSFRLGENQIFIKAQPPVLQSSQMPTSCLSSQSVHPEAQILQLLLDSRNSNPTDFTSLSALVTSSFFFFYFYFCCCSSTVVSIFTPPHPSSPTHPCLPPLNPLWLCAYVLYTCSLLAVLSPIILLPPPLWLLSVCSLLQCLWLYFACLFVLLIGSTYRWDHMVFVFHHLLACFT